MKLFRRSGSFLALVMSLAVAGCAEHDASADAHGHAHAQAPAQPQASDGGAPNAVQNEMRLLSAAMEATVRAIGSGDVRAVPHELHRVHEARQATEAALEGGRYHPPKNGANLARFVELDGAFHARLEELVESSAANDVNRTADAFGAAMKSCQGCHSEFRQ